MTVVLSLLVFVIAYSSYFVISHSKNIQKRLSQQFGEDGVSLLWIVFQRLAGVFCLGVFPGSLVLFLTILRFNDLGFSFSSSKTSLFWTIGLGTCVLIISYFFSGKPENFKIYPQIRDNPWTTRTVVINTGSWLIYLVAYEFLFRGLVLFTLYSALGLWPAILVTTCLYALVHIPKGLKEAFGALPFGVVLGLITIEAGSIWSAVFIHLILAISNDHFALLANPDMHFKVFMKKRAS